MRSQNLLDVPSGFSEMQLSDKQFESDRWKWSRMGRYSTSQPRLLYQVWLPAVCVQHYWLCFCSSSGCCFCCIKQHKKSDSCRMCWHLCLIIVIIFSEADCWCWWAAIIAFVEINGNSSTCPHEVIKWGSFCACIYSIYQKTGLDKELCPLNRTAVNAAPLAYHDFKEIWQDSYKHLYILIFYGALILF